jgi:hypothetical protein
VALEKAGEFILHPVLKQAASLAACPLFTEATSIKTL